MIHMHVFVFCYISIPYNIIVFLFIILYCCFDIVDETLQQDFAAARLDPNSLFIKVQIQNGNTSLHLTVAVFFFV